MKVKAIAPAFYKGNRVRVGAEVEVADDFKASWFVPNGEAVKAKPAAKTAKAPATLSEMAKEPAKAPTDNLA